MSTTQPQHAITAFDRSFEPRHGEAVVVAENIVRITAANSGPMTFTGTNTYLIGHDELAIVDPGPDDADHLQSLLKIIDNRPVKHILVTHTHRDHTALLNPLQCKTGALIAGCLPHHSARDLHIGEINRLDAAADHAYAPDIAMDNAVSISVDGLVIEAIHTPGHTANHLCFSVGNNGVVLTGDHVMGWATSVIAPPDGSMSAYMSSLERLLERRDTLYLPGHGGPIHSPQPYLRALKTHRKMRERAIIDRLFKGDSTISQIVGAIYRDTDARLHGAAALSVMAHLEDLTDRKIVSSTLGPPETRHYEVLPISAKSKAD